MCGRFSLTVGDRDIEEEFKVNFPFDYNPRFNIAPTQKVIVLLDDGERRLDRFQWGLIPSWAKDKSIGNKLINARAETVSQKPSFRTAFTKRRCLVLADGFYEWQKTSSGKIPMFAHLRDRRPFGFAGLWENWQSPKGESIRSCAIITTEPNSLMKPIHNRMPVILPKASHDVWLDVEGASPDQAQQVLRPFPAEEMEAYAVSKLVNSPKNDKPECLMPAQTSGDLFSGT